jgi:hypothetical protein
MTTPRYAQGRRLGPPRLLVIHSTAGSYPGDYGWLRAGGSASAPVSIHYYIRKTGDIVRFVDEGNSAYHCGASSWVIDGVQRSGSMYGLATLNWLSIGIELENRNTGKDAYPEAQIAACVALSQWIVGRYGIPESQLVRHLDIAPGRKTDPAGFPWATFVRSVFPARPNVADYDEYSPLFRPPVVTADDLANFALARSPAPLYHRYDVHVIARFVHSYSTLVGLDPVVVWAQIMHETGSIRSWWSQRPRRNSAGIGVTGRVEWVKPTVTTRSVQGTILPTWAQRTDGAWLEGISFPSWEWAIRAQVGRLLLNAGTFDTGDRQALAAFANEVRPLPEAAWGSVVTLKALGHVHNPAGYGWAWPGDEYGAALARMANAIVRSAGLK